MPTQRLLSMETLMVPIGPKKLVRALQVCQENTRKRSSSTSTGTNLAPATNGERGLSEQAEHESQTLPKGIGAKGPVSSENGVRYHAILPHTVESSMPHRPHPASERRKSTYKSQLPSVLCVHDNPINLSPLRAFNKRVGCENVVLAQDGLQAFEAVKQQDSVFDIIFVGQYQY